MSGSRDELQVDGFGGDEQCSGFGLYRWGALHRSDLIMLHQLWGKRVRG